MVSLVLVVVATSTYGARAVWGPPRFSVFWESFFGHGVALATIAAGIAFTGPRLRVSDRLAAGMLFLANVSFTMGDIVWSGWDGPTSLADVPPVANVLWLSWVVVVVWLVGRSFPRGRAWRTVLDVVVVVATAIAVLLVSPLGDIIRSAVTQERSALLPVVVVDVVVFAMAVSSATLSSNGWARWVLAICLAGVTVGDLLLVHRELSHQLLIGGLGTELTLVTLAPAIVALAATIGPRPQSPVRENDAHALAGVAGISAVLAVGVVVAVAIGQGPSMAAAPALLVIAVASVAGVLDRREVARVRRTAEQAEKESHVDELTGLANRRRLYEDLDLALGSGEPFVVALIDLDGFKKVNDSEGHLLGDRVLRRAAEEIDRQAGTWAAAYRLGGDEFVVLARDASMHRLPQLSTALGSRLPSIFPGLGASIGIAHAPAEAGTRAALLHLADQRMFAAKTAAGRER